MEEGLTRVARQQEALEEGRKEQEVRRHGGTGKRGVGTKRSAVLPSFSLGNRHFSEKSDFNARTTSGNVPGSYKAFLAVLHR